MVVGIRPWMGNTWTEIVGATSTNVLVLDASAYLRFIPDSTNGTTAELTFLAWDQSDSETSGSFVNISSGNQGNDGAYSLNADTFSVTVTGVNDQPILDTTTSPLTLTAINEGDVDAITYATTVVSAEIGSTISDVDSTDPSGIAITKAVYLQWLLGIYSRRQHVECSSNCIRDLCSSLGLCRFCAFCFDRSRWCHCNIGLCSMGPNRWIQCR